MPDKASQTLAKIVSKAKTLVDEKQDKAIAQIKKKLLGVEYKILTPSTIGSKLTGYLYTTPYQFGMNARSIGTSETNRIGSKFRDMFLKMNVQIRAVSDMGEKGTTRILIVLFKQNNGATTIPLDGSHSADTYAQGLFNNYTVGSTTQMNTEFLFNETIEWANRFKVIYDKSFTLNTAADGLVKTLKIRRKLDYTVDYSNDNDGDMEDVAKNGLYFIALTDAVASGNQILSWDYMIKGRDM